jgi:hypothetical protein
VRHAFNLLVQGVIPAKRSDERGPPRTMRPNTARSPLLVPLRYTAAGMTRVFLLQPSRLLRETPPSPFGGLPPRGEGRKGCAQFVPSLSPFWGRGAKQSAVIPDKRSADRGPRPSYAPQSHKVPALCSAPLHVGGDDRDLVAAWLSSKLGHPRQSQHWQFGLSASITHPVLLHNAHFPATT